MPNYLYDCENGHRTQRTCKSTAIPIYVKCHCGKRSYRHFGSNTTRSSTWPFYCSAMGVHPSQIEEAARLDIELGVPTDYHKDGRPKMTSQRHRREYHKAHGRFDKDAAYGDATPTGDR